MKAVPEGQEETEYNWLNPRELGDLTRPYADVHKHITTDERYITSKTTEAGRDAYQQQHDL